MMSTGIVAYENPDSPSERVFRLDALKLFLEVTLPLMAVTFTGSYGVYWWVHRNEKNTHTMGEDIDHAV